MSTKFVKPNPYVFPFKDFKDLGNKDLKKIKDKKTISLEDIKSKLDLYNKNLAFDIQGKDKTIPELLFDLFMHPQIRFGELSMYKENKNFWLDKFTKSLKDRYFKFSILGFPFKVTYPLKTNRKMPDLGEVFSMNKLENLAAEIHKITGTKTTIYIVTEGAFAPLVGSKAEDAEAYEKYLQTLAKKLGFKHLQFIPLKKMEKYFDDFPKAFKNKISENTRLLKNNDSSTKTKIDGAYPIILRIVNPRVKKYEVLMDAYNYDIPKEKLNPKAKKLRKFLEKYALKATIDYFSYLQLRDDANFLTKEVGEDYLPLTVSPKPNRLGIIPIDPDVTTLPHHGVPVYFEKKQKFNIMYLIDLLRSKYKITKVFLKDDTDHEPFYYILE